MFYHRFLFASALVSAVLSAFSQQVWAAETNFVDKSRAYKTAFVCFLGDGDCERKLDFGFLDEEPEPVPPSEPVDPGQECVDEGYTNAPCIAGYVPDEYCPYDSSYYTCDKEPCAGYDYTYAEATAQGYVPDGSCQDGSTKKYKRIENPCVGYSVCACGGEPSAARCYTGATLKFSQCKPC